jgi:hypothetical protein
MSLTQTIGIPVERTPATYDDGIIATGGRFQTGSAIEILGQGFGASQGTGSVVVSDSLTIAASTAADTQTVDAWSDGYLELTGVITTISDGTNYLHVTCDGGDPVYTLKINVQTVE